LRIIKDNKKIDKDAITLFTKIGDASVVSQTLKKYNVKKEDQKEIVENVIEKLESETYENIKTGRGEKGSKNSNPRKDTKLKAAVEEAIEDKNYKIQKENFEKIFPKELQPFSKHKYQ